MPKVSLVSLGCSKNLIDAEQMMGLLEEKGYILMENEEDADIMIVNTCTFIESAKQESIDCIFELVSMKQKYPDKKIIVTGCMAQRYQEQILEQIPEVDLVIGTNEYYKITDIISDFEHNHKTVHCNSDELLCEGLPRTVTTPSYTAYLRIAEGCDNHCTYCVIPSVRGSFRSRKMEHILEEAEKLAKDGVKELIVIAQDTTCYGKDIYGHYALAELLKKLCCIKGVEWIRVHYCYPERVTDELIEVFAQEKKICKYFDIPIQHCNDEILRRMGRRTNKAQITELIQKLRTQIPDVTLRTSLIVGFPGETEEQFIELQEFVEKIKFDRLGVFAYSQEEDTPAAKLSGQIEEEEKEVRRDNLMIVQADISAELNRSRIGQIMTVLVEGKDEIIKNYYGRTYADSIEIDGKVFFKSDKKRLEGDFVQVRIDDCLEYDLFGEEVQ